jgi:predicted MPP superfamily phosphohydrolase
LLRLLYRGDWPARLWEAVPGSREVECIRHELRILPPGQPSLRVGYVSDLHAGPTTPDGLIDAAFTHLALADLDILLLGGDYVFLDADETRVAALAARIEKVRAKKKLAVLGNHDLWTHHDIIERAFARAGVEFLINRNTRARDSNPGIAIVGLDEPWTGRLDARTAFEGIDRAEALVVLCHSPDGLPDAAEAAAVLPNRPEVFYVCGHTHGGHIATPWGPVIVPGIVGKKYPAGLYEVGRVKLFVSRGVGGIELPMRAWARPEVAVFEFSPRASSTVIAP